MGAVEVEDGLGGAIDPAHTAGSARRSFPQALEKQFEERFDDDARRAFAQHGSSAGFSGIIGRF